MLNLSPKSSISWHILQLVEDSQYLEELEVSLFREIRRGAGICSCITLCVQLWWNYGKMSNLSPKSSTSWHNLQLVEDSQHLEELEVSLFREIRRGTGICPCITLFVRCGIYLTTYDWIKSFLKITIEGRAIYGNLENKINTLYWPVENSIPKNNERRRNDADGKLQKVSGRCLILSSDHYVFSLRTSKKVRQT